MLIQNPSPQRICLTGAPGAGKSTILEALRSRGYHTVEEAATALIGIEQAKGVKEPWAHESFLDQVCGLQRSAEQRALLCLDPYQFFDRSPICTHALAVYLGRSPSKALISHCENLVHRRFYTHTFFIANLGVITRTQARQISYDESLKFEQIHRESYARFGVSVITIAPDSLIKRIETILALLGIAPTP